MLSYKDKSTLLISNDRNRLFLPLLNDTEEFLNELFPEDHRLLGNNTGTVNINIDSEIAKEEKVIGF